MTGSIRWQRLKELFAQTLEQPEEQREAWAAKHCGNDAELRDELLRLISQQRQPAGFLGADAQALLERIAPQAAVVDERLGSTIGAYRLTRELGAGGMGRVYLAERADGQFAQQVALKLIRSEFASTELRQRFLRERDTLARLAHPNIAQLHDGGLSADGTPYFTLEYIEGVPITRWCNERRSDVRARVRLMLKVCDAVQHAHRNLVVHRDLKPSNILVTAAGEPKLLDFGIAKPLARAAAESTLTSTDAQPMTREYAAPEQVLGEPVTTATDIYTLGVLLYLLLCGRMPYRRAELGQIGWTKAILEDAPESLHDAVDRSVEEAAPRAADESASLRRAAPDDAQTVAAARGTTPVILRRALRGDLERIVQRALAKTPEARYPTVNAFVEDLQAYLAGRALSGGTRTYRLRKFVRRHWLPLGAGVLLLLVVLGSAIGMAWQAAEVERHAQTTAAVKDFLLSLFQKANPNVAQGKLMTLRDAVDAGVQKLDKIPASQPELKAELQVTLGTIYFQLGLLKEAAAMHAQAFEVLKAWPRDAVLAATAERFQATEVASLGDYKRGQELADDAVLRLRALSRPPPRDLGRALSTASWVANKRADVERVKQLSEEALALASQPPQDEELMYLALEQKALVARKMHDPAAAAEHYRKALALSIKVNGAVDQQSIAFGQALGSTLGVMGQYDTAQQYVQAAFDAANLAFGEDSSRALRVGEVLSLNEFDGGHVAAAATRLAHLLELGEAHTPRDESLLTEIRLNYAEMLTDLGQYERAQPLLLAVRDFLRQHSGIDPNEIAETLSSLGELHIALGQVDLAADEAREALSTLSQAKADYTTQAQSRLSHALLLKGDVDGALASAAAARDNALKLLGERAHDSALAHYSLGMALAAAGKAEQAEAEWRAALQSYKLLLPPEGMHLRSADARLALGSVLAKRAATRNEGLRLLDQAASMRAQFLAEGDPRRHAASEALAKAQASRDALNK